MTCRQLIEFHLSNYLEGALAVGERVKFDEHLSVCPACRRYLSQFTTAIDLTRSLADEPDPELPPDLVKAIVEAAKNGQA